MDRSALDVELQVAARADEIAASYLPATDLTTPRETGLSRDQAFDLVLTNYRDALEVLGKL